MSDDVFGLVGTTIADKFRVDRVIGDGGFGVVYGGMHMMLNLPVAIKCLKPSGYTPEEQLRANESFLREARILFELGHPAIVRLYDVGLAKNGLVPFAVLELIRGLTLAHRLRAELGERGPPTPADILPRKR